MVGRDVNFVVEKKPVKPGKVILDVQNMTVASKRHKNNAVNGVSLTVREGEIVCIAGIDGNGQTEFVYGLYHHGGKLLWRRVLDIYRSYVFSFAEHAAAIRHLHDLCQLMCNKQDALALCKDGRKVEINNPNDADALGIGMVHQHFKLVECFSVYRHKLLDLLRR